MTLDINQTNGVFRIYFREKQLNNTVFLYAKEQKNGSYQLQVGRGYGHLFLHWIGKIANKLLHRIDQKKVLLQEVGQHFAELDTSFSSSLSEYLRTKKISIQVDDGGTNTITSVSSQNIKTFSNLNQKFEPNKEPNKEPVFDKNPEPKKTPKKTPAPKKTIPKSSDIEKEEKISKNRECVEEWRKALKAFRAQGVFDIELWQLSAGQKVGSGSQLCRAPDLSEALVNLPQYCRDLDTWTGHLLRIQNSLKEKEMEIYSQGVDIQKVKEALEEILLSCRRLASELEGKDSITSDEKSSYHRKFFCIEQPKLMTIYQKLGIELRNAEQKNFKRWLDTMVSFALHAGNSRENREVLRKGIEKIRQCLVHRKPSSAESLAYGETGSVSVVFQDFLIYHYFNCNSTDELSWFEKNVATRTCDIRSPKWIKIATIYGLNGHFTVSVDNGKNKIFIDNLVSKPKTSSPSSEQIYQSVCINNDLYNKLVEKKELFSTEEICVPTWNANNCYLSAAFLSFAVLIRFLEEAELVKLETV